jgi:geranylgeranyl diphosphate synthase type I
MTQLEQRVEPRTTASVLRWSRDLVDPALRAAVDTLPEPSRHIAGYHCGWWDEHGEHTGAGGGKALRPTLTLLSAQAAGGGAEVAVPAAVAVELTHNFSLLHDDVMDNGRTRRHRPTAWTVFGVNAAILTGDALQTLALHTLADSGHPAAVPAVGVLGKAVLDLITGQHADLAFERRDDVTRAECVAMARHKTASLLAAACTLGGLFANADPRRLAALLTFGLNAGLAFQHVDDLLGIWGDPAVTGKPVHSDLRARKKSLPVVAALTSGTPAGGDLVELYAGEDPLSESDVAHAAALVDRAGGRAWSQAEAHRLLERALDCLPPLASPAAAELARMAMAICHRDS